MLLTSVLSHFTRVSPLRRTTPAHECPLSISTDFYKSLHHLPAQTESGLDMAAWRAHGVPMSEKLPMQMLLLLYFSPLTYPFNLSIILHIAWYKLFSYPINLTTKETL